MQQETADELRGRQRHELPLVVMTIVAPAESHLPVVELDESAVGYGDAVRVAAEVAEDLRGPGERPLGVDHPLDAPELCYASCKGSLTGQPGEIAEERQPASRVRRLQMLEEQASEQSRED